MSAAVMSRLMLPILLFASGILGAGPAEERMYVKVQLRNTTTLRGTIPYIKELSLKTRYAPMMIPIGEIQAIQWGDRKNDQRDVVHTIDGPYRGRIENINDIVLDTGRDTMPLPCEKIEMLKILAIGDAGRTIINDTFDGTALDKKTWTGGGNVWRVEQNSLFSVGNGSGLPYSRILSTAELDDAYTLEADLRMTHSVGILWHAQEQNLYNALWFQSAKLVQCLENGSEIARWNVSMKLSNKLKLEINGTSAQVFLNDQKIGEVNTGNSSGSIGFYNTNHNSKVWIDNVKVTYK